MRMTLVALCALSLSGCATRHYNSVHSAEAVSNCISVGWRKSPKSGFPAPVSLTKAESNYFVGVELHPTSPSLLVTGTKHPFYPVWAEVRGTPVGSSTIYHRAYQLFHKVIDAVVVECQERPGQ